jgi:hypothetical protein
MILENAVFGVEIRWRETSGVVVAASRVPRDLVADAVVGPESGK